MPIATRRDPLPAYRFHVEIGGIRRAGFRQVSGLDITIEPIEAPEGGRREPAKLPGRVRYADVTLRYGVVKDPWVYDWVRSFIQDKGKRYHGSIVLVDHEGKDSVRWNFFDGWPTKLTVGDLNAEASEVLVDTLVLSVERLERA
jgi:phage tail-like protein